MNKKQLERFIIKELLKRTHDDEIRIADTAQKMLRIILRPRIESALHSNNFTEEAVLDFIAKFAQDMQSRTSEMTSKEIKSKKRIITRRNLLQRILKSFANTWPFGN